jgi:transcriptional regulator with XRE-family HTH domain
MGYGVEQAAGRMGLEPRQLRRIERGEANLTLDSLLRLAAGLDRSPSALLRELEQSLGPEATSVGEDAAPASASPERDEDAPPSFRSWLAREVVARRLALHLTQRELASRASLSMSAVQSVERGRHAPTTHTLEALASALGCSLADLMQPGERGDGTSR